MPKKIISPSSKEKQTNKEKTLIVMELLGKYKFKLLLEIANISKQAFYYQAKHLQDKDIKDELFFKKIENIFQKNYCKYGSPRITIALNNELKKHRILK